MLADNIQSLISSVYAPQEYPVCDYQSQQWKKERPLDGLTVLDATPIFRNSLVKYKALMNAGAQLTLGYSTEFSNNTEIFESLRNWGMPMVKASQSHESFDLILDCAGLFSDWEARLGYVELTRSGVVRYKDKKKPVFLSDGGHIKRIETSLGTGEGFFRAMAKLGYTEWKGKIIVVFGSGKVGQGIIRYAYQKKANVYVVTDLSTLQKETESFIVKAVDMRNVKEIATLLKQAYAVVSATGIEGALTTYCTPQMFIDSPALLANMGVMDEYGKEVMPERVLNNKRTLNFMLKEPTHLKYIDATLALHNRGALYVMAHPEMKGLILPPQEVEEELLKISKENGMISDELTWIL